MTGGECSLIINCLVEIDQVEVTSSRREQRPMKLFFTIVNDLTCITNRVTIMKESRD